MEEMFLCRLLETDSIDSIGDDAIVNYVEKVLSSRHSFTSELIKSLEDTIAAERVKTESMALALQGKLYVEGWMISLFLFFLVIFIPHMFSIIFSAISSLFSTSV